MAEKRYAVLIGNGTFSDPKKLPPLRCPERDVTDLARLLESETHGSYQALPLINETSDTVLDRVYDVVKDAGRDDLVLVYWCTTLDTAS